MSGIAESAKDLTSPAGKAASQKTQQTENNAPRTPTQKDAPSAPRSMPDIDDSQLGSSSGDNEGEMVPAAGRINDNGEVIDDDGTPIGKVTDGEASKFAGFVVTQEGDILDEDGGVVGKAEPLDDVASDLNYTTENTKDQAQEEAGGAGGLLSGVANTAGSVVGGVGQAAKDTTGAVGDTAKGATVTVGEATGTQELTGAVGDTTKGATDAAGDVTKGATDTAGQATEGVAGAAEGAASGDVEGATEGVKDTVGDTAEGVKDTAGDATGDVTEGVQDAGDQVKGATDDVGEQAEGATDIGDKTEGVTEAGDKLPGASDVGDKAEGATEDVGEKAEGATDIGDKTEGVTEAGDKFPGASDVGDKVEGATEDVGEKAEGVTDAGDKLPGATDAGDKVEGATDAAEGAKGAADDAVEGAEGAADEAAEGATQEAKDFAEGSQAQGLQEQAPVALDDIPELSPSVANKIVALYDGPFTIADGGKVTDQSGKVLGKLAEGSDFQSLIGKEVKGIDENGNLLGENDTVIGKVDIAPEGSMAERVKEQVPEAADRLNALEAAQKEAPIKIPSFTSSVAGKVIAMFEAPFNVAEDGQITDQNGKIVGKLAEGQDFKSLVGKDIKGIDAHGNLLGDNDTELGKVDLVPEGTVVERIKEEIPEAAERLDAIEAAKQQVEEQQGPDLSILEGLKINKSGNVVDRDGNPVGRVISGDPKKMAGRMPDKNGKVWDDRGNIMGEVEVLPEAIKNESSPFEDFPDAKVDKFGKVIYEGRQVGVVVGDDWQNLIGKTVDADGDILDKNGNVIGHAERREEEEPEEPEEESIDYSSLKDKKVNKLGNVVDDRGEIWGHVVQGIVKNLAGKRVGDEGKIYNDAGKVIGQAEPIPESERADVKEPAPFEDYPDAVVGDNGDVLFNGEKIGEVVEGDAKKLKGKPVDADGDILDRAGNLLGRAERWEKPEEEPEPEVDMSSLAGKRINKAGNAVDSRGDIYGRVIEGNLSRLIGKMCDKQGFIRNEGGDVIGKCELIPEAEREGMKEGPFTELSGCVVTKEGKVISGSGDVVGRLTSGDPHVLAGRPVDDDGDICDKNGNVLGHAERWEEPEVEKDVNPMSGRKVNREGNVVDENGDIIGKLTTGELSQCAGKKIDDDGDVIDQKGNVMGHCSLLQDIPEPEEEPEPEPEPEGETDEEREERLRKEQDAKIAQQISYCIEQSLDKIRPILRMIVERINQEEAKSEEDRDEEELVKQVRPLIEEGGKILTEANGVIRGLDPDGRISAQAKHHTAGGEATPEEYHLAELLKELTGEVTETIEAAKRKLENLPKAKKQINPLWGLLSEPLFQIIAAVGLLLSGVLGLVGKLLNGLGLGGLVNNLLGGLGLNKVLDGLGLGSVLGGLTGGGKKK
ncbi:hypothetical protein F4808DRAFT_459799 [Astrocystis sublimbata]|nr:hypothetical protein F4808DRAFT_459799 [Astrocystis sublimbata]